MNTFPYTNAAREGRTTYGEIEVIGRSDRRHRDNQPQAHNRAARRAVQVVRKVRLKVRRVVLAATEVQA